MGVTGAGKSSFISRCCQDDVRIGHDLMACTSIVTPYKSHLFDDPAVYLIDTPGFDDTSRSDSEVLREIAAWLTKSYADDMKLTGIIYLHRISDFRMPGSAKKNLRMFKQLCGEAALKNVILTTTMWDLVNPEEGEARENQLRSTPEFWGWMIEKGSSTFRYLNTTKSARETIQSLLPRPRIVLDIQQQMVKEGQDLDRTNAGKELESSFKFEKEQLERMIADLRAEMHEAIRERDVESQQAIREAQSEVSASITRLERERERLKIDMEKMHEERLVKLSQDAMYRQTTLEKEIEKFSRKSAVDRVSVIEKESVVEGSKKSLHSHSIPFRFHHAMFFFQVFQRGARW